MISGATLIFPLAINSMACGYSPDEAHEPCNRICRVTTFCSGSVTSGWMLPISVTVPPLRVQSIARGTVSFRPTASYARSTPRPAGQLRHFGNQFRAGSDAKSHPHPLLWPASAASHPHRQSARARIPARARGLQRQQADHARADHQRRFAACGLRNPHSHAARPTRLQASPPRRMRFLGQAIENALRHHDKLSKRAMPAVISAGNADHLAVVAEIHFAALAERALAAVDRRVEGDAIARGISFARSRQPRPRFPRLRGPSRWAECAGPTSRRSRAHRCRRCRRPPRGPEPLLAPPPARAYLQFPVGCMRREGETS